MRVVGTAGHVDHGKSTLVQRLTGIDPDRWAEEKKRGLTIDLGFAWFDLPNGGTVGVVDVPGHRDFIENMLAGIGGIDLVLLIIAADEGIMPQTREHLAILDLLAIPNGLIVITKTDLIQDEEWLDLIELDIQETVHGTVLENAEILRVSAKTNEGISDLIDILSSTLDSIPNHTDYKQPRLPVDRVFTVDGFGTVVTGTLSGGTLEIGDTIEIQPQSLQGRIRGLQSYKQEIQVAIPGSRVAVNISGVDVDDINRGDVLAYPNQLATTQLIDVHFRHLSGVDKPLKHNAEVKFFSGASETIAHVRLLDNDNLPADATGWLQLSLRDALALTQGERFILRYPSPPQTIGGGVIVNPQPDRRWKRFDKDVIQQLETRLQGTPSERVMQATDIDIPQKWVHLQKATAYSDDVLSEAIQNALEENRIILLPDDTFWSMRRFQVIQQKMIEIVGNYHTQFPLKLGIPREELRSRLNIKNKLLTILLALTDEVQISKDVITLVGFEIQFSASQEKLKQALLHQMSDMPFMPPSYKEALEIVGDGVLHALIDLGEIIQISSDVIFKIDAYRHMSKTVLALIDTEDEVDAKLVRDTLNTSRKYAIALLEHLDAIGVTRRVGDVRVRGKSQTNA